MTHGEVFLQGKCRQAPVSRERSRGSRWAPASMGELLNPRRAGGSQRHGVSSAPTHMRLLGCSQSQTGWLAPAGPCCLWTPHSLGQIWLRHPSPAAGFGVLWAATQLAWGSPTESPSKQTPVLGNASRWVIWKWADMWGLARLEEGPGEILFSSGHHQPSCYLLGKMRNWQTVGKMPGFKSSHGPRASVRTGGSAALSSTEGLPTCCR